MKEYRFEVPAFGIRFFVSAENEKSARQSARDRFGYGKRLPKGTKVYLKTA